MGNSKIIAKPDWVSWNAIHNVLWAAHANNRDKGISMRYASLSGEEIRQRVEGKGKMFCAIIDDRLVGTAAIVTKKTKLWFNPKPTEYAYFCFASVLPGYTGQGVYKQLLLSREKEREKMGLSLIMFDTHENNQRVLAINRKNGFKPVDYKFYKDHFNVVMVNWPNGCPFSDARIKYEFLKRKIIVKIKYGINKLFHKRGG